MRGIHPDPQPNSPDTRENWRVTSERLGEVYHRFEMIPGVGALLGEESSVAETGTPPLEVANCLLALTADVGVYNDAGVTLATNGQTVQQWNDQSGNSNHASQATAGARPTFVTGVQNGLPVVRWGGAHGLVTPAIAVTTFSLIVVFRGTGAAGILVEQGPDINANDGFLLYPTIASTLLVRKGGVVSSRNLNNNWGVDDQWFVAGHFYGGSHATHHLRLGDYWPGMASVTGNQPGSGSVSAVINIGSRNNAASLHFSCDIIDLFLHSPAPTIAEVKSMLLYEALRTNIP